MRARTESLAIGLYCALKELRHAARGQQCAGVKRKRAHSPQPQSLAHALRGGADLRGGAEHVRLSFELAGSLYGFELRSWRSGLLSRSLAQRGWRAARRELHTQAEAYCCPSRCACRREIYGLAQQC
jgi:hypothetical protein